MEEWWKQAEQWKADAEKWRHETEKTRQEFEGQRATRVYLLFFEEGVCSVGGMGVILGWNWACTH